jgi:hypothetical protein
LQKREGISNLKRVFGEAGAVEFEEAEIKMKVFRKNLVGYDRSRIYNADETGLFYAQTPNTVYLKSSSSVTPYVPVSSPKARETLILSL